MNKLVTIKIGSGNSDLGYPVILEIAEERSSDSRIWLHNQINKNGKLPSTLQLLQDYHDWQKSYRDLDTNYRLEAPLAQIKNISFPNLISSCQKAGRRLLDSLNHWLNTESFQPIRECLAKNISSKDRVRFLLQIEDPQLHHLPWQVAEFFEEYNSTEVVLSSTQVEISEQSISVKKSGVRVLAILGNSERLNLDRERKIFEKLILKENINFLVEPQRSEINDRLWEQPWDILFFAGHSSSSKDNTTGEIYINQTDKLDLQELRYGLKKAISNGLKIAIFNSCDGLGLAKALSDLKIPQVIVMRAPVPDRVAQKFLTAFLTLYANGNSFYRSIREAREKLQGLEDEFPCATWLPTVYQHGATHAPTWEELQGEGKTRKRHLQFALLTSLATTIAISAIRFVGILQPLELNAFDVTMRSRPSEVQDRRILVVKVTQEDVERQKQQKELQNASSLSNSSLDRLLNLLEKYQSQIIGIDTFLNREIPAKYTAINTSLVSGNLIPVCKVKTSADRELEISPPLGAKLLSFADTIADRDGTMRRQLLSMDAQPGNCNTPYAISTMLAYQYLQAQDRPIELKIHANNLQLGTKQFQFLTAHTGGYQQFDSRGYQMLVNYRSNDALTTAIPSISLGEILTLSDPQKLKELIADKIVLIGTTDSSFKDISKTPYAALDTNPCPEYDGFQCIPGVFLQAQMTSQLISAALDNRPLFWAHPFWIDSSLVLLFTTTGAVLAWGVPRLWILVSLGGGIIAILYSGSVVLLTMLGYWFPLIPAVFGLIIAGTCVKIYLLKGTKFKSVDSKFSGLPYNYKKI
jgi:CHASE2 domain-containing sensor protein